MSENRSALSRRKQGLAVAAMSPVLSAILLILKSAFEIQAEPNAFAARLALLIQLLGPLLLGIGLISMGRRLRRPRFGGVAGIVAAALVYLVLIENNERVIAECAKTYGVVCGEWSIIGYTIWGGMWLVDALALLGIGAWLARRNECGAANKPQWLIPKLCAA